MFNSFYPYYLDKADIKIDFNEGAYFEVIDPDTGETKYILISTLIGQETSKTPGVGDYILREERIDKNKALIAEPEPKEEVKKSLWDEEIIDRLCEIGEVFPITSKELEKTLSLAQNEVYEATGIDWLL